MTQTTATGRELAAPILNQLGATYGSDIAMTTERICSLIARRGPAYQRLQEDACNVAMDKDAEARHHHRERLIEIAVALQCQALSKVTGLPIVPEFQGDPRGNTIRLKWRPDDDLGVGVPGS